ncbi:MAG: MarR family winged helix-turn-helix transcriptional regulator [Candidatus Nanopelagicales bacterium]
MSAADAAAPTAPVPSIPALADPTAGTTIGAHLPDVLVDGLDRAFRRLRKSMVRPPAGMVPVPSLGRQLDIAKIFACDAVAELTSTSSAVAVKDVAAALDLEHSTVSRLLGEVEEDGLVSRGVDPADRRRTTVALTPLGHAVVADSTAMTRFLTRILLADWPRRDVEDLTRLLSRLADTVQARVEALPELAQAEMCRAHGEAPPAPDASGGGSTPRRGRRR